MTTVAESKPSSRRSAVPRFATPRSPERETLGPQVGALSTIMKRPPMPHQQLVYDVALEIDPETGLLAYDQVIVVIMRQQGKTEMAPPVLAHRALELADRNGMAQRTLYTAQTADAAREKWRDHQLSLYRESPLRSLFVPRLRLNAEAVLWINGSAHSPASTTGKTGGTGGQVDLGWIDEAWVHDDGRVEQGMRPAMLTRRQPQMWIVSMVPGPTRAETTRSRFLRRKQARGRAAAEEGITRGTAYFEWSAPKKTPDGRKVDPGDPATWLGCMPALCPAGPPCECDPHGVWHHTVFLPAIQRDFDNLPLEDFTSEYLGWWSDEDDARWLVITEAEWEDAKRPDAQMRPPLAFGAWVHPDRTWAAIGAAGRTDRGRRLVEITGRDGGRDIDYRKGIGWVLPRLKDLDEKHQPLAIVTNDRAIHDQASDAGLKIHRAQAGDEASAAAMLFDGIAGAAEEGRDVRHLGQRVLTTAMAAVAKRTQGQWWVWDRADEDVDIAPVPAVGLALWGLSTPRVHIERPQPAGRPKMRWMT